MRTAAAGPQGNGAVLKALQGFKQNLNMSSLLHQRLRQRHGCAKASQRTIPSIATPSIKLLACIIHDNFGKSLKDLPRSQSSDLSKKQSVF